MAQRSAVDGPRGLKPALQLIATPHEGALRALGETAMMDLMRSWEQEAARWVRHHIQPELLEAWLFDPSGEARDLDEVWTDLERTRRAVRTSGDPSTLADLYCAAYRWQIICANPSLDGEACHQTAMVSAFAEVYAAQQQQMSRPGHHLMSTRAVS